MAESYIVKGIQKYTEVDATNITSNKTFSLITDGNKVFTCTNSSAITLTIPTDSTFNHAIGTQIAVIRNGAGTVTFSPASGVTLNSDTTKRAIKGQFNSAALLKIAANTWSLVGSLE
jgi:virulence-associated protein VagC